MGKDTQKGPVLKNIREFSSGGAVYKKDGNKVLWLVTASQASTLYPKIIWRLPKGWIDDKGEGIPGRMASGETKADENSLREAAIREVKEEGGVEAKIIAKIRTEKYFFKHPERGPILKFVTFYLMEWVKDLPEGYGMETSEILWLPIDEALKKVSYSSEKKILQEAQNSLKNG